MYKYSIETKILRNKVVDFNLIEEMSYEYESKYDYDNSSIIRIINAKVLHENDINKIKHDSKVISDTENLLTDVVINFIEKLNLGVNIKDFEVEISLKKLDKVNEKDIEKPDKETEPKENTNK